MSLYGSHLPNCPPSDAESASKKVYRFVQNNPPEPEDFITVAEREQSEQDNNMRRKYKRTKNQECRANGFSVYTDINDLLNILDNDNNDSCRKIAVCNLNPKYGVIKHTPGIRNNSHHTWWPDVNLDLCSLFKVIKE